MKNLLQSLFFFFILFLLQKNIAAQQWLWAKDAPTFSFAEGTSAATDHSGNVYVAGTFGISITFGPFTLSNGPGEHLFLAKYDGNGNVIWAKQTSGSSVVH